MAWLLVQMLTGGTHRVGNMAVVMMNTEKEPEQGRDQKRDNPGPGGKFRHQKDYCHQRGDHRAHAIQKRLRPPMTIMVQNAALGRYSAIRRQFAAGHQSPYFAPANDHAGL